MPPKTTVSFICLLNEQLVCHLMYLVISNVCKSGLELENSLIASSSNSVTCVILLVPRTVHLESDLIKKVDSITNSLTSLYQGPLLHVHLTLFPQINTWYLLELITVCFLFELNIELLWLLLVNLGTRVLPKLYRIS